jgi:hypothetical protein
MLYRQSIILFGIILPVLATAALIGGGYFLKAHIAKSYQNKLEHYSGYEIKRRGTIGLEEELNRQRPHVERWKSALAEETASTVTTTLREIASQLPAKEYQLTAFHTQAGKAGFGAVSAQPSSQLQIAFRGTYRTMQQAFLELETRMPQLQLQELRIDPTQNQPSHLNFQVTYTSWQN